jgi:imidazolonepropionase-like amidohydrolase
MKWLTFVLGMALASGPSLAQPQSSSTDRWILTATRLYVAPNLPPVNNAWVLVNGAKIEAIGRTPVKPPKGVRSNSTCSGGVITAGFQNSHVHFMGPRFEHADTQPRAQLEHSLVLMLTGWGYTTVVDTGSDVANTVALRQRIERGELQGPAILTAGIPLFPVNGIPIYLRDAPPELLRLLAQPATAEDAIAVVGKNFALGANGTKLFIATPQEGRVIKRISAEIAAAAADETHRRGGLVMAHPTDLQGVKDAVAAGVDIIVHTTIDPPGSLWTDELIGTLRARNVSVIPTLKLWTYELDKAQAPTKFEELAIQDAQSQLKAFSDAGGQVLFGTDVGYMSLFDPTDEYVLMAQAGLTPMQILVSLTTAPAARWNAEARRGRVQPGLDADLVVLNGDPGVNVRNFADVKCTIRRGREVYRQTKS